MSRTTLFKRVSMSTPSGNAAVSPQQSGRPQLHRNYKQDDLSPWDGLSSVAQAWITLLQLGRCHCRARRSLRLFGKHASTPSADSTSGSLRSLPFLKFNYHQDQLQNACLCALFFLCRLPTAPTQPPAPSADNSYCLSSVCALFFLVRLPKGPATEAASRTQRAH